MDQKKDTWVQAHVSHLFSQALRIGKNEDWSKTERSKAYATYNAGKALISDFPPFIEFSFQDFLWRSVGLYYDRNVAPASFENISRTPAQSECFYATDTEGGEYATLYSKLME